MHADADADFEIRVEKSAIDEDRRLVAGFAYVAKSGGQELTDTQGDSVDVEVLREAAHDFMKSGRTLGIMHIQKDDGSPVSGGQIVEIAVLGGDFTPPGLSREAEGLWIVAKVEDDDAWAMVKAGIFRGFSIGGKAVREARDD